MSTGWRYDQIFHRSLYYRERPFLPVTCLHQTYVSKLSITSGPGFSNSVKPHFFLVFPFVYRARGKSPRPSPLLGADSTTGCSRCRLNPSNNRADPSAIPSYSSKRFFEKNFTKITLCRVDSSRGGFGN